MHADIQGALQKIDRTWRLFVHKGRRMSRLEVETVLKYALEKGYKTTAELTDEEVDEVLNKM